jgi:hypothetical protein
MTALFDWMWAAICLPAAFTEKIQPATASLDLCHCHHHDVLALERAAWLDST